MRSPVQVNEDIVNRIREEHGTLDEFPRELANTVANVYYRFYEALENGMDGFLDRFLYDPRAWPEYEAHLSTDVKMVRGLAEDLGRIDKDKKPNLH